MTSSPRWRVALASAASAAVLVAAPLVGAQTAHAAAYPPPPSCLTLSATVVHVGERVHFHGTGFTPRERISVALDRLPVSLRHAHHDGTVDGHTRIPWFARGWHQFRLTGWRSGHTCVARIHVLRRGAYPPIFDRTGAVDDGRGGAHHPGHERALAQTGSEKALAYGGTAAGMMAAGGGMLFAARRRRSS
ncbi:LPXTG cell wall anchor domain-containing protein [Streptomyces sp. NPDC048664]|uniref:LPXTG cell wall anchor domain-containing protein n=1 Tax=Streptomyces sp. NPDC048664 TaxID=3154505 RepID=UPI003433EF21